MRLLDPKDPDRDFLNPWESNGHFYETVKNLQFVEDKAAGRFADGRKLRKALGFETIGKVVWRGIFIAACFVW